MEGFDDLYFLSGVDYSVSKEGEVCFALHDKGLEELYTYYMMVKPDGLLFEGDDDIGYRILEAHEQGEIPYGSPASLVAWNFFKNDLDTVVHNYGDWFRRSLRFGHTAQERFCSSTCFIDRGLYGLRNVKKFDIKKNSEWEQAGFIYNEAEQNLLEFNSSLYYNIYGDLASDVRDAEFEMAYAVRTEDYEDAAECRDKIEGIRQKVGFYD